MFSPAYYISDDGYSKPLPALLFRSSVGSHLVVFNGDNSRVIEKPKEGVNSGEYSLIEGFILKDNETPNDDLEDVGF